MKKSLITLGLVFAFLFTKAQSACQANFTYLQNGPTVVFTDQSIFPTNAFSISWFWDFGDGSTSYQQNPTHTYAAGIYNIACLTVSSFDTIFTPDSTIINSCTYTYCDTIFFGDPPADSWDCDPVIGCFDPGTGLGQYGSLLACFSICDSTLNMASWDCDPVIGCYDPGTGLGQYATLASCQAFCDTSSCPIECQAVNGLNISTAYDNANQTLYPTTNAPSFISTDPNWIVIASPDQNVTLNAPANVISANSAWYPVSQNIVDNDAGWISPYFDFANGTNVQINGSDQIVDTSYTFRNCFCLCESDTITIDLLVSADNYAEISLLSDFQTNNEVLTGIGQLNSNGFPNSNFYNQTPMSYTAYLNAGKHCLIAELYNKHAYNATGLRVEGLVTSASGQAVEKYTCCDPNIYISGTKYIDTDCDGLGESYGSGWTINLYDGNHVLIATTVTDVNGYYTFEYPIAMPNNGYDFYVSEVSQSGYSAYNGLDEFHLTGLGQNGSESVTVDFINCEDTSSCPIECQAVNGLNISTAYDNENQTLYSPTNAPGFISTDPNWILVASPDQNVTLNGPANVISPIGAWHNNNNAGWISPYFDDDNGTNVQIQGGQIVDTSYTFRNCFCLCEADYIDINLLVSADNYAEISLLSDFQTNNEVLTGIGQLNSNGFPNSNYYAQEPMFYSAYLNAGKHCLIAELYNQDQGLSTGLKVEGTVISHSGQAVEKYTCCDPNIYISGTKYIDTDCDGLGESYGSGWTINLYDGNHVLIATTVTDVNGYYTFEYPIAMPNNGYDFYVSEVSQSGYSAYNGLDEFHLTGLGQNGSESVTVDFINCEDTCDLSLTYADSCWNINDTSSLANISVSAVNGTGPYTFIFSVYFPLYSLNFPFDTIISSDPTVNIDSLPDGHYCVQIIDADSCVVDTCFEIFCHCCIHACIRDTCVPGSGGEIEVESVHGGTTYTYHWTSNVLSNIPDTNHLTNLPNGMYYLTISDDSSHCVYTDTITIHCCNLNLTVSDSCRGIDNTTAEGDIYVSVHNGLPPFTYTWSNGGLSQTIVSSLPTTELIGVGDGTYCLDIMDADNCSTDTCISIDCHCCIEIMDVLDTCYASGGDLEVIVSAGSNHTYTYSWTSTSLNNIPSSNHISNLPNGEYFLHIEDAHSHCFFDTSFVVECSEDTSNCELALSAQDVCISEACDSCTITIRNVVGLNQMTTPWALTVYDLGLSQQVSGGMMPVPTGASIDNSIMVSCYSDTLEFYMDPSVLGPEDTIKMYVCGYLVYEVFMTGSGPMSVTYPNALPWSPGAGQSYAENLSNNWLSLWYAFYSQGYWNQSNNNSLGGSIDLTVSGGNSGYAYFWSGPNAFTSSTEDINGLIDGTYCVTVIDLGNPSCPAEDLCVIIDCDSCFTLSAGVSCLPDTSTIPGYVPGGSIAVNVSGGSGSYIYSWDTPGLTGPNVYGLGDGVYCVTVTDANNPNCVDELCITVNCPDGCTDPTAYNYDPAATTDDGSCLYHSACVEPSISGLFIDGIIDDRVNANFDNKNTYDINGNQICRVDQIRIQYRPLGTSTWFSKNIASPTGYNSAGICNSTQSTMKPIRNLTLGTEYEWRVKVWYCSGGNGGWVYGANFTTADECPNIDDLSAYGSNPTKATFTWNASNGVYEFVRIKMRVHSLANPTGLDWFLVGGFGVPYGTYTKNKNGLIPGETYRAQARTWCDPNGGAYNSLSWTPLVTWTQPTNRIDGGEAISNLDVYPNPSKDIFNITFTSEQLQDLRVKVLNIVGEEIILDDLQQFVGEYTKQINLQDYAKGIYFLEIETDQGLINKKLIMQ